MSDEKSGAREDAIEQLIRSAGRGPAASPAARARVYAATHAVWRREVGGAKPAAIAKAGSAPSDARRLSPARSRHAQGLSPARSRRWAWLAMAAAVATIAVVVGRDDRTPLQAPTTAALVSAVEGALYVRDNAASVGQAVLAGDTIRTGAGGRAAIDFPGGAVLRVDQGTTLELVSTTRIELERGTVYVDSGAAPAPSDGGALEIGTQIGAVTHVGTQYEVHFADDRLLRVRVREGRIRFRGDGGELAATAGEQVLIPARGAPRRSTISAVDPAWSWAEALAVVPGSGTQSLATLLRWLAREMGRELRFADDALAADAEALLLHGVGGLTPAELREAIEGTTSFGYRNVGSDLVVTRTR